MSNQHHIYGLMFIFLSDINQSPLGSPILERRHPSANMYSNDQIQQQIASLKQQQEFQQRLLVEQFRQQQQQMAQEHEKQLQEHIKVQQVQEHIKMQQVRRTC